MNFSKLYECWHFAEILAHPSNVERHNLLQNRISAIIPSPSKGEERYDDKGRFRSYMKKISLDNEQSSTMIKELVEEIDRLKSL
tara:strand:- start:200 stop:451 length:252 start_codon:yes stop_codon:yes gene_type:complete